MYGRDGKRIPPSKADAPQCSIKRRVKQVLINAPLLFLSWRCVSCRHTRRQSDPTNTAEPQTRHTRHKPTLYNPASRDTRVGMLRWRSEHNGKLHITIQGVKNVCCISSLKAAVTRSGAAGKVHSAAAAPAAATSYHLANLYSISGKLSRSVELILKCRTL